jgi:hypothetical protein
MYYWQRFPLKVCSTFEEVKSSLSQFVTKPTDNQTEAYISYIECT